MRYYWLISFVLFFTSFKAVGQEAVAAAKKFILKDSKHFSSKMSVADIQLSSFYKEEKTSKNYTYFNQTFHNIEIYNAIFNVVLDEKLNVIHNVESFENLSDETQAINWESILKPKQVFENLVNAEEYEKWEESEIIKNEKGFITASNFLSKNAQTITIKLEWLPTKYLPEYSGKSKLILCWRINMDSHDNKNHWLIHIDANNGKVLKKDDLVLHCEFEKSEDAPISRKEIHEAHSSNEQRGYRVFDIPTESPIHGNRTWVSAPYNRFVENGTGPGYTNGWHSDGYEDYLTTRGNNVYATADLNASDTPGLSPTSSTLNFDFDFVLGKNTSETNRNAAVTNLFYWNNVLHNILYKYGFDEASGNFQNHNMGRGGLGGDYVRADAQDASGTNNADFYTPIDGGAPRMQMYLYSQVNNYQPDADFDNGIISHEYGHGWSTRLTGGPATNTCLRNYEQAGEGWSDYLALMLTTNWNTLEPNLESANIPRSVGTYVKGQNAISGAGTRPFRYSYDMENVNPTVTYGKVNDRNTFYAPHGVGSIWATMLWDMTWEIIMQDQIIVKNIWNVDSLVGNVAALKLVHEGLRLQPCSPSMVDARNAILMADIIYFNGKYRCSIDKAFARRGLGGNASTGKSSDDSEVFEDFTLLTGPKLTSLQTFTICTSQAFSYTATSSVLNTNFTWTRASVDGIEEAAASGNSKNINEVLTNTTKSPIEVKYIFYLTPTLCGFPPAAYTVKVIVLPTPEPRLAEYHVCQNTEMPALEGLLGAKKEENTLFLSSTLSANDPKFNRNGGTSGSNFYYKETEFTSLTARTYVINQKSTDFDSYLYVYSSFDPLKPLDNLLSSNDDGGSGYDSRIVINLTSGQSITVISTSHSVNKVGTFTLEIAPEKQIALKDVWFKDSIVSSPLSLDSLFNPLLVSGSGISSTQNPGIYTFYYSNDLERFCRIPVYFVVDAQTQGGNIAPVEAICKGANLTLTLQNSVGNVLRWEKSTDNFQNIQTIQSNSTSLNLQNIQESAKYRAVLKSGVCLEAHSSEILVNILPQNLSVNSDFSSGINTLKASNKITANNKINSNAQVFYHAEKSIELLPGFLANSGTVFVASIEGCN